MRRDMLTSDQLGFYRENGYLLLTGVLPPDEVAALRSECHDLAARLSAQGDIDATWGSAKEAVPGAKDTKVLHCHNVQFFSAAFTRLICDERFVGPASAIIGSPNVQLHHT